MILSVSHEIDKVGQKTLLLSLFLGNYLNLTFPKTNPLRFHEGGSYFLYFSFSNSAFNSANNSSFVCGAW